MNKRIIACVLLVSLLSVGIVLADKPTGKDFKIPSKAREVAPGIYKLGYAIDNGRIVEGYALIRYKKGFAKPGTTCGNGICEPGENANKCPEDCSGDVPTETTCYGFLGNGVKWKVIEPYMVDTANSRGLSDSLILNGLEGSIVKWEIAAGKEIIGSRIGGIVDGADTISTDGKNEVMFGDIPNVGAIGVTIVWGVFQGPPGRRQIVEWDQIYDDVDFDWSDCAIDDCTTKMDFENIAIHELGHSIGMGDLYESACSEETMYGYAGFGETNKRTLNNGDIVGVNILYG